MHPQTPTFLAEINHPPSFPQTSVHTYKQATPSKPHPTILQTHIRLPASSAHKSLNQRHPPTLRPRSPAKPPPSFPLILVLIPPFSSLQLHTTHPHSPHHQPPPKLPPKALPHPSQTQPPSHATHSPSHVTLPSSSLDHPARPHHPKRVHHPQHSARPSIRLRCSVRKCHAHTTLRCAGC